MTEIELLNWVRGPGFQIASIIFIGGVIIRILEILMLGRAPNLAEAKGSEVSSGMKTVFTRFKPAPGMMKKSMITIVAGYVFHLGLFITIFLFAPHILLIKDVTGLSWPALPNPIVDAVTVVTIITLVIVLINRLQDKVLKHLTNFEDILVWAVTILPLITGYVAYHRIGMSGPSMLAVHIISVELLMVVFPFTKLMHTFTLFMARYYNGAISGYRGVQS